MTTFPSNPAVTLTTRHPLWERFCEELYARLDRSLPGGCGGDHHHSRALFEEYGFDPETTLCYFEHFGGYCDCEVLFNVESGVDTAEFYLGRARR
jgi:hypothetical protein